jgi:hypothetical protein
MQFDNEDQKFLFLQLVEQAQWPGGASEKITDLKEQIRSAPVSETQQPPVG